MTISSSGFQVRAAYPNVHSDVARAPEHFDVEQGASHDGGSSAAQGHTAQAISPSLRLRIVELRDPPEGIEPHGSPSQTRAAQARSLLDAASAASDMQASEAEFERNGSSASSDLHEAIERLDLGIDITVDEGHRSDVDHGDQPDQASRPAGAEGSAAHADPERGATTDIAERRARAKWEYVAAPAITFVRTGLIQGASTGAGLATVTAFARLAPNVPSKHVEMARAAASALSRELGETVFKKAGVEVSTNRQGPFGKLVGNLPGKFGKTAGYLFYPPSLMYLGICPLVAWAAKEAADKGMFGEDGSNQKQLLQVFVPVMLREALDKALSTAIDLASSNTSTTYSGVKNIFSKPNFSELASGFVTRASGAMLIAKANGGFKTTGAKSGLHQGSIQYPRPHMNALLESGLRNVKNIPAAGSWIVARMQDLGAQLRPARQHVPVATTSSASAQLSGATTDIESGNAGLLRGDLRSHSPEYRDVSQPRASESREIIDRPVSGTSTSGAARRSQHVGDAASKPSRPSSPRTRAVEPARRLPFDRSGSPERPPSSVDRPPRVLGQQRDAAGAIEMQPQHSQSDSQEADSRTQLLRNLRSSDEATPANSAASVADKQADEVVESKEETVRVKEAAVRSADGDSGAGPATPQISREQQVAPRDADTAEASKSTATPLEPVPEHEPASSGDASSASDEQEVTSTPRRTSTVPRASL